MRSRSDLESSLAERDHLVTEVERMRGELQTESEAVAEGEDAVIEEAAVTGVYLGYGPLCLHMVLAMPQRPGSTQQE